MKKLVGILILASMPFIVNAGPGFITGFATGTMLKQDNSYAQSEKFLNVGNGVYIPIYSIVKVKIGSEKDFFFNSNSDISMVRIITRFGGTYDVYDLNLIKEIKNKLNKE